MDAARLETLLAAARIAAPAGSELRIRGADPVLGSRSAVGEVAAVAMALAGAAAADLWKLRRGEHQAVGIDVRDAAMRLLGFLFQVLDGGLDLARHHHATTGLYETRDGRWIHLHGGFPHLAAGTLELLDCGPDAASIASAVRAWDADDLEDALAARGLCGALVRTPDGWAAHPQGRALAPLPAVEIERVGDASAEPLPDADRPLGGVRALDLTRVLAGPACTRTLAEHGADVLRIGAQRLPSIEPFAIETGHGKRSAFLDLERSDDLTRLRALARDADVFCQGYRPGALAARGLGPEAVAALRPGIVYVSVSCYGHGGPWAGRRGWEQLAQSAVGIASVEARDGAPTLVPAAVTDYTTGALAAFGAMVALARRAREGGSWHVRASLCQTGMWLTRLGAPFDPAAAQGLPTVRFVESDTAWGRLRHLTPCVELERTPPRWERPPCPLGAHAPEWLPRAAARV